MHNLNFLTMVNGKFRIRKCKKYSFLVYAVSLFLNIYFTMMLINDWFWWVWTHMLSPSHRHEHIPDSLEFSGLWTSHKFKSHCMAHGGILPGDIWKNIYFLLFSPGCQTPRNTYIGSCMGQLDALSEQHLSKRKLNRTEKGRERQRVPMTLNSWSQSCLKMALLLWVNEFFLCQQ